MAQIRVEEVGAGQHPSEVVVAIETAEGHKEKLVIDRRSIRNQMIDVGYPVGDSGDLLLVELPRESIRGLWRVWVPKGSVVQAASA